MDNRALLAGIGIGAALAFAFEPSGGSRRRALLRDKMVRGSRRTGRAVDATLRDLRNRSRGVVASARGHLGGDEVGDATLLERVRAKLGRVCSHPRAIDVEVDEGDVTLRGPILAAEIDNVLATVAAVRGVSSVLNELDPHESSAGIPALQGRGRVAGPSLDLLQDNWAPATRALVGFAAVAASGLAVAAYARRWAPGPLLH